MSGRKEGEYYLPVCQPSMTTGQPGRGCAWALAADAKGNSLQGEAKKISQCNIFFFCCSWDCV